MGMTGESLGTQITPVPKKKDNQELFPCYSCGHQYVAKWKKNGRKWKVDIDGTKYVCAPVKSTCPSCKMENDVDIAVKKQ